MTAIPLPRRWSLSASQRRALRNGLLFVSPALFGLAVFTVWPIIQSVDVPAPLSAEAYAQALDAALSSPAVDGLLVFNLKGVLTEAKLAVTQAKFL